MIVELIKSDKLQSFNINLSITQMKLLENTIRHEIPLKFLIMSMDKEQKKGILEMLFVVIFKD